MFLSALFITLKVTIGNPYQLNQNIQFQFMY